MNIYDPYPDTVDVGGRVYRLDLAYDNVLRVIDAQDDGELSDVDRIEYQTRLLLADGERVPRGVEAQARFLAAVFDLFPKGDGAAKDRYIDLHQDAAMIRSGFFRIGVDLLKTRIHFFQFLELLADLPEDTALMRTVAIRARPLPKPTKHNAEEIAALQKAKARVAIQMSDEERRERFARSLRESNIFT